jgi:hypothetical protein
MRDEEPDIEIPEGWTVSQYRFSGNFKLIAEFRNEATDAKVCINPYRSYNDVPGLEDCHRVVLISPDDEVEEIAKGLELEYVEDAEQTALDAMKEYSEES